MKLNELKPTNGVTFGHKRVVGQSWIDLRQITFVGPLCPTEEDYQFPVCLKAGNQFMLKTGVKSDADDPGVKYSLDKEVLEVRKAKAMEIYAAFVKAWVEV
jgi:hypothetical protein